jgi:1-acyl-sn-glycerol-3-phosphate acyltransferase
MFIPMLARILEHMPKKLAVAISNKIVDYCFNKYTSLEVIGKEKLSNYEKPVIFICNHLSNADGIVLNKLLKEHDVTFVAGVKLSNDPYTNIGVNVVKTIQIKPNTADKEALTKIIKTIKDGNNILIFPEGTRSRTGELIEPKKGIILIAKLANVPILPMAIWGTEKLLPINESGNMSAEKFVHADVKVNIGEPIRLPDKEKGEDKTAYEERAVTLLMKSIAELLPQQYRGKYRD